MSFNYQTLNKVTIKNKFMVHLIQELMDRMREVSIFTKLDLRSSSWQVRIVEGEQYKTICVTMYGAYKFLFMLFGLTNTLGIFCNLMNDMLYDYLDDFALT
jgi:hypothetical protein